MSGHLAKLELEPGDVLVVAYPEWLEEPERDRISASLKRQCPGHPIMFIDGGMSLGVIKPDKSTKEKDPE